MAGLLSLKIKNNRRACRKNLRPRNILVFYALCFKMHRFDAWRYVAGLVPLLATTRPAKAQPLELAHVKEEGAATVLVDYQWVLGEVLQGPAIEKDEASGQLTLSKVVLSRYRGGQPGVPRPLQLRSKAANGDAGSSAELPSGTSAIQQKLVSGAFMAQGILSHRFVPCIRDAITRTERFGIPALSPGLHRTAYAADGTPLPHPSSQQQQAYLLDFSADYYCSGALHGCRSAIRVGFYLGDLLQPQPGPVGKQLVPMLVFGASAKLREQPPAGSGSYTVSGRALLSCHPPASETAAP